MGGVPRRRKRPHHEFMPLWKEHAALARESRLASLNFQKGGAAEGGGKVGRARRILRSTLPSGFAPFQTVEDSNGGAGDSQRGRFSHRCSSIDDQSCATSQLIIP